VGLTLALLFLLLPVVHAGPMASDLPAYGITNPDAATPATLYAHVLDGLQDFPLSTQAPDPRFQVDASIGGLGTQTLTCLPDVGATGATERDYHTLFGYASPGRILYPADDVDYNARSGGLGGHIRVDPERGLPYEVGLDGKDVLLHWFLSTNVVGTPDTQPWPVAVPYDLGQHLVLPDIAVHAWMRSGEAISLDDQAYKQGALLAEGETVGLLAESATATTEGAPGGSVTWHPAKDVEGRDIAVYEFTVALHPAASAVPAAGFNLQVTTFVKSDACPDPASGSVMPNLVRVHTSAAHRPRLELGVTDPVRLHYVHPQFVQGVLVLHASADAAWGQADVDPGNATAAIDGPTPATGLYRALAVQRFHEHNERLRAVDLTFVWPYTVDGAADGTYLARVTVPNRQHTANATSLVAFTIGRELRVVQCGVAVGQPTPAEPCSERYMDADGNLLDGPRRAPAWGLAGSAVALLGAASVAGRRLKGAR
jgi:hypothetical protein